MTQYAKPAVRSAWAETATPADIQDPGNTYVSAGWQIGVKPPRQYENWQDNYTFAGIRYLCQQGIATYDPAETYPFTAFTASPINGCIYHSLINGQSGNDPAVTGADQIHWDVPYVATSPLNDNSVRIANTAFVAANYIPKGSTFAALSGQVSNGQVPLSAVQQYQGNLSIAFSQLSGSIFNSQVPLSAVQQWQGNLAIAWGQITGTKNADQLQGLVTVGGSQTSGNTIMVRDPNGYAYAANFNQSSPNSENPPVGQFLVTNGVDNFFRKSDVGSTRAALAPPFQVTTGSAWWEQSLSGNITQWGKISLMAAQGSVFIPFSRSFPNVNQGVRYSIIAPSGVGGAGSYENFITSEALNGFTMTLLAASNTAITINWEAKGH